MTSQTRLRIRRLRAPLAARPANPGTVLDQRHRHRRREPRRDRRADLIPIDPIPSYVWYQDMADFAEGISDGAAGGAWPMRFGGGELFVGSRTSSVSTFPS